MSKKYFLITSSLLALACASPAGAQTLEETIGKTFIHHPQVESAKTAIGVSDQDIKEQRSGYYPELSANASGGRMFGDNSTSRGLSVTRGDGYSYLWEGGVSARQMIYDADEVNSRVSAALTSKKASNENLLGVRETLAFRATQTYINLLRARFGYNLIEEHEKNVSSYLDRIRNMVNEGVADETELQQARDVVIILDNYKADYLGQLRAAESDFFELTGMPPTPNLVKPASPVSSIPETLEAALQQANMHPAVRAAMLSSKATQYDITAEESALYPDIDGELSYLKTDKDDIIGGEATDARALVKMNWAFETGGAQMARIKKRNLEHQESLSRTRDIQLQTERGIRLAYAEHETAQIQAENQLKRLDLNKKLLETYEAQFEGARVSLLQLMQAENQLFNTRLEKINAEHRLLLSEYGILASLGHLQDSVGYTAVAASTHVGPRRPSENRPAQSAEMLSDEQE